MRKSGILNLRHFELLKILKKNRLLLLLCFLFFCGVIVGSSAAGSCKSLSEFGENNLQQILLQRREKSFAAVFISAFADSVVYLTVVCAAGASLIGVVLSPVAIIWRGFCYGLLTAFLYNEYALKGIAFNAVMLIPPAVFSVIALIFGAREAMTMSLSIAKLTLPRSAPGKLFSEFRSYCIKFALLIIPMIFASLTDASVTHFFIGFFDL